MKWVNKMGKQYTAEDVIKLQTLIRQTNVDSLDREIAGTDDAEYSSTVGDFVVYDGPTPDDIVMEHELRDNIAKAVRMLPPRQAKVMTMRFGLDGELPMTLEEVGKYFGVTRSRIQQIEGKALKRLRWVLLNKFKINK